MILRAKYIIVDPETVIENGAIAVQGASIKAVLGAHPRGAAAPWRSANTNQTGTRNQIKGASGKGYDLGNAVITPGLINPHTHLEGPELYGGIPPPNIPRLTPPQSFTEWAQQVIRIRQSISLEYMNHTVAHGYQVCIQNGTTTIGDHTHLMRVGRAHRKAPIRRILFEEIFNLNPLSADDTFKDIQFIYKSVPRSRDSLLTVGLAPHSPFSASGPLYQVLFTMAKKNNCPMSTHLSELKEEVRFTRTGKGKMAAYLKKIGRYFDTWRPPYATPVEYMHKLGILKPPAFFVHCNYLSGNDIRLLANSGASVVFCPASHHYFGHKNHPFRKLIRAGVNVALGTDGLGSNSDLHILKEMKFVAENYNGLTPSQIFQLGTINGAKTLRLDHKIGVIKTGYQADLAAFPLKGAVPAKEVIPYIIHHTPQSIFTMVAGKALRRIRNEATDYTD